MVIAEIADSRELKSARRLAKQEKRTDRRLAKRTALKAKRALQSKKVEPELSVRPNFLVRWYNRRVRKLSRLVELL